MQIPHRPLARAPGAPRLSARVVWLVAGLAMAGCRGCEGGSGADFAKSAAPAEKTGKRPLNARGEGRDALRTLRRMKMRVADAAEVDRPLGEAVSKARGMLADADRLKAIEAKKLLEAWLVEHPEDADAHYWKGRAELLAEEPRGSTASFASAIEHAPDFVAPYRWAGYAHHQLRDCKTGMPMLDKAVELAPEDPDVYVDRVVCGVQSLAWEGVLADIEKLCTLGEAEICEAKPAVESILDRRRARADGREQGKRTTKAASKKGGKLGKSGFGAGGVRDIMRKRGKGKSKTDAPAGTTDAPAPEAPEAPEGTEGSAEE